MSVIKQCGGYDKAKIYVKEFKKLGLVDATAIFERELLEFRRADFLHFEVGDKVTISHNKKLSGVYTVESLNSRDVVIKLSDGCFIFRKKYTIQHATDEEIAAGKRL